MKSKIIGFILIIIVGIIFGISSYIWLAPKNKDIDKIDINISSNILVSTDSKNFKKIITKKDISNGIISKGFNRVSTTLSKDEVKFFKTNNNEIEETTTGYTVFDLYFKTNKEESIYLTDKSNIIYKGEDSEVKDSIRIGFIYNDNSLILEPNYDTHTIASINNAYSTNHLYLKEKDSKKQSYKAINNNKELVDIDTETFDTFKLDLNKGITKVKVYIWIESNDVDAYKELTGEYINYILDFEIKK